MTRREAAVLVACAAAIAGCDPETVPRTQTMVRLGAEALVQEATDEVLITVEGRSPQTEDDFFADPVFERSFVRGGEPRIVWPRELAILPAGNDPRRLFRYQATVRQRVQGELTDITAVRAISGFIEGRTLLLPLEIPDVCFEQRLLCRDENQTCVEGRGAECPASGPDPCARCVSAAVDPADLEDYGAEELDAGVVDASTDAQVDDSGMLGDGSLGACGLGCIGECTSCQSFCNGTCDGVELIDTSGEPVCGAGLTCDGTCTVCSGQCREPSGTCTALQPDVGASCSEHTQCGLGGFCMKSWGWTGPKDVQWPGGYCTVGCYADEQCPAGSACTGYQAVIARDPSLEGTDIGFAEAGHGFCAETCQNDGDCPRSGYVCAAFLGDVCFPQN